MQQSVLLQMNDMKTLVWDFNGTIVDDAWLCLDIERKMLRERNMNDDWTIEQYRDLFCFPVIDYYYKIGYTFEKESYDDISIEFNERYDAAFHRCGLVEGFREKIAEAEEKGYQNVIVSATRQDRLADQVKELGIDHHFVELIGTDDLLASGKVAHALKWMKDSSTSSRDCVYIGDSTHDKETADAMGIPVCWLTSQGHFSYERLKEINPDHTVYSLKEIVL